jgi:hypothetical protein
LSIRLIIHLGTSIEYPFGCDLLDKPLQKYFKAIEMQVKSVFHNKFKCNEIGGSWPVSKKSMQVIAEYGGEEDFFVDLPAEEQGAVSHKNPSCSAMNLVVLCILPRVRWNWNTLGFSTTH